MFTDYKENFDNHEDRWIIRSILDTDFYKFLMMQFIFKNYSDVDVTFQVMNRSKTVILDRSIDIKEFRNQLDYMLTLSLSKAEAIFLNGNKFYGNDNIFSHDFIDYLCNLQLPNYKIIHQNNHFSVVFSGKWHDVMLWETYAISIINELRTRQALKSLNKFKTDILYSRAKIKLYDKIQKLKHLSDLKFVDFGTRRRHSFDWQEYVVESVKSELPHAFVGTSNVYLAMKHDLEAIGTNAHELPMVLSGLAIQNKLGGVSLKESQYLVCKQWKDFYPDPLHILLPDTFGTTQFLNDAPDYIESFIGMRIDSKDPMISGEEYISWLLSKKQDPKEKLLIPSDGLDVEDIIQLYNQYNKRIRLSFGWGTMLTNDFKDCHPDNKNDFDPISLVCKVTHVNGEPVVKLSDNYNKATGSPEMIEYYRSVFGTQGVAGTPVLV